MARRLHHCYVVDRDLDSPVGELAGRVVDGCRALQASRVLRDGGFVDTYNFEKKLNGFQCRALFAAAVGRGEHARTDLLAQLGRFEVLAAAVLGADVAFRDDGGDPGTDGLTVRQPVEPGGNPAARCWHALAGGVQEG